MKWVVYFFLLATGLASFAFWVLQDPGYIEITWLGYEVQFSVIVGFFTFLFFFLLINLIWLGLSWFLGIPFQWVSLFHKLQGRKAKHELLALLSSLESENFSEALYHQKKAAKRLGYDPLFQWIAGNAFEKADKPFEAEKYFIKLAQHSSTLFLGLKSQIRAALHREDFQLAQGLLERAEKLVPTSPWVLKRLLALAHEKKNFKRAEDLTLHLEDLGYFTEESSKKQIAHLQYLQAVEPETPLTQKEALLRQAHGLNPYFKEATETFVQLLYEQGHHYEALQVLENVWPLTPTQTLGDLYLKISSPLNNIDAYQLVSQFVKPNPKDTESLLLLARTALKAHLWGEARTHLMALLHQKPTPVSYFLLATLELEEHQDSKAARIWLEKGYSFTFN